MNWIKIVILILAAIFMWLALTGCAYTHVRTPEVEFTCCTLMKDIAIDPNGIVSTTTPKAEGIIGAFLGFVFGYGI